MSRRSLGSWQGAALGLATGVAVLSGCRGGGGTGAAADTAPVLELLKNQQYDDAIARVGERSDPESLYLLGLAWAGKARLAPLPTPAPGARDSGPGWKPEEQRAIELLQRAVAGRSDLAGAHQALAELMAPHAIERLGAAPGGPARPGGAGPDASVEVVLGHFTDAIQADTRATAAAESLVQFAIRVGRLAEADAAYQELLRRRREDPALLVRYGDFLAGTKGDPDAALAQYAQALMWRPDDGSTRQKVAEIHLRAATEYLKRHEYAAAEARLSDARRAGASPASAVGARLRELEQVLRDIRGR